MNISGARRMIGRALSIAPIGVVLVSVPAVAYGATLYVDGSLGADCNGGYDPAARACAGGTDVAFSTIAGGAAAANPGDVVLLREGTYSEQLSPAQSGAPGMPITFQGFTGEMAIVSGVGEPAVFLLNVSHLVIADFTVQDVLGWGRVESSTDVTFQGMTFRRATATGTTGGLKLVKSTRIAIRGNVFDDGNDSIVVQESDRNLIEGNTLTKARHSLLSVRCGNFNIVRANRFENADQKAGEIYDCEAVSDAPYLLDATKRNLFEGNTFALTMASNVSYDYNGIQYAGQQGIVRRNVFHDNLGGGLGVQVYPDEALYNYGHRIYHNTFFENRCYGISASNDTSPTQYFDNVVRNNLLYKNEGCAGETEQVSIGNTQATLLSDNALAATPPGFVDETARDLHLTQGSPMIDAAAYLTHAVGAGNGTVLTVEDAGYFFDGYGVPGQTGDRVQIEGRTEVARVVSIDYAAGTLTLDVPLTWADGEGVSLEYAGTAPDVGAFELGLVGSGAGGGTGAGTGGGTGAGGTGAGGAPANGTGAGGAGAGTGSSGGGGNHADPSAPAGCGCRTAGSGSDPMAPAFFGALCAIAIGRAFRARRSAPKCG